VQHRVNVLKRMRWENGTVLPAEQHANLSAKEVRSTTAARLPMTR
jgi:hypothetical protein